MILFKRCLESWLVISASAFCATAPLLAGFEGCTQHSSLEKEVAAVSKSLSHNREHPEGEETIPFCPPSQEGGNHAQKSSPFISLARVESHVPA